MVKDTFVESKPEYTVFVGGVEVVDYYVTDIVANIMKIEYELDGYDDVVIVHKNDIDKD